MRVLIADDEALARRRLRRLLEDHDDVEVVGECVDGVEVLSAVQGGEVDLVLLDIQMPRLTGLDAAALLRQDRPLVVFVTAHAEHAVEAFDRDAADYLLKPVEPDRLARALDRVRRRLEEDSEEEDAQVPPSRGRGEGETTPAPGSLHKLAVPTRKGVVLLDPTAISHVVLEGESCVIHAGGHAYITDFRLTDLERRLASFQRLHRKALVNLDHVVRLEPVDTGGYLAHMRDGEVVEVSRQASRRLRRLLDLPR